MFITPEILQKRGACQEYLDFFVKRFPNGVEMLEMIEHGHMPYHALHWGYQHLDPSPEEVAAYWKKVCVVNSQGVHESDNITNSTFVATSSYITDSSNIYDSKNIVDSNFVVDGEWVEHSNHIAKSTFVDGSSKILKSVNVTNSNEVYSSNYVLNSDSVFESSNVVNSSIIWKSENITDCGFCFGCHNITNSLFCEGAVEGEYLLFNKPVDKLRFDMIMKQFKKFAIQLQLTEEWPDKMSNTPRVYYDYRKHLTKIPAEFWRWVRSLPGYGSDIMYSLTFDPQFLN